MAWIFTRDFSLNLDNVNGVYLQEFIKDGKIEGFRIVAQFSFYSAHENKILDYGKESDMRNRYARLQIQIDSAIHKASAKKRSLNENFN